MEASLTHVRLLVKDYKACFHFYRDALGLRVAWGNESTGYAEFLTGEARLAVFGCEEMAKVVGRTSMPEASGCRDELVVILRVPDVDKASRELKKKGVVLETEPLDRKEWGIRTAHFRDPDGNLLEINCRLPRTKKK